VLTRLGSIQALNVTRDSGHPREVLEHAIDLSDVFRRPQILSFHLPFALSPHTSPEVARMVAFPLLVAAKRSKRRFPVFLVIDEFQRMVANNLEAMLQLARSMDVSVILANQTMADLKKSRTNLIPAIEANCRFRQCFGLSLAEDRDRVIKSSGETIDYLSSISMPAGGGWSDTTTTIQQHILSRLGINDVLLATDHPHHSIVRITRGKGYAQYGGMPFVVEADYHISREEYERRKATPWPTGLPGTFVPCQFQPAPQTRSTTTGPVVTTEVVGSVVPDATPSPPSRPPQHDRSRVRRRQPVQGTPV